MLVLQNNLADSYEASGRLELALSMRRYIYFGRLRLYGKEHHFTISSANNYADSLMDFNRFDEAKALMRKMIPVARRAFGERHRLTLRIRWKYAETLRRDPSATLDDLREVVTMLEETAPIARRVLGSSHPVVVNIEKNLGHARETLRAREEASSTVLE